MKKLLLLGLVGVFAVSLEAALAVGDSYEKVIAEKGQPSGRMEGGGVQVLRYGTETVRLRDGKVVAVESAKAMTAPAVGPAPKAVAAKVAEKRPVAPPKSEEAALAWTTDYAAALAQAKEDGRHVFLFFTGSDWCGWCKRLQREILATPEFAKYAREKLVLVELDFPRGKPIAAGVKSQNAQLARRYRIEGYPTVVVLDSSGKAVGRMGYQRGGPGPFIEALSKL